MEVEPREIPSKWRLNQGNIDLRHEKSPRRSEFDESWMARISKMEGNASRMVFFQRHLIGLKPGISCISCKGNSVQVSIYETAGPSYELVTTSRARRRKESTQHKRL